jgi:hypothetical protein
VAQKGVRLVLLPFRKGAQSAHVSCVRCHILSAQCAHIKLLRKIVGCSLTFALSVWMIALGHAKHQEYQIFRSGVHFALGDVCPASEREIFLFLPEDASRLARSCYPLRETRRWECLQNTWQGCLEFALLHSIESVKEPHRSRRNLYFFSRERCALGTSRITIQET